MVISQTPFRMSFFGGGTDFKDFYQKYGGAVISTSFDKYCYVTVRNLPAFFDYNIELSYSKIERVTSIDDISHPLIKAAMAQMQIDKIRLTYEADLPARSGLGTSSSFAVGMINAFHALRGEYASKRMLADEAIFLERELCQEAGGIQDQIAVSFGGFNRIDFNSAGYTVKPIIIPESRKRELNDNLMLFFTGFSRLSYDIQKSFKKSLDEKKHDLLNMLEIVDEAEKVITSKCGLNEFGRLLNDSWRLKRGITSSISTESIDYLYSTALANGAIGGKILGAGGGGFLLFYVEKEKQEKLKKALKDVLYVPFEFENGGARILFYNDEGK